MKTKALFAIAALSAAFAFQSCQKDSIMSEDSSVNSQIAGTSSSSKNVVNEKSSLSSIDSIAMAANIDDITYNGSDQYTVSFYDGTGDYVIDINSFNDTSYIDYTMTSSSSVSSDVTIDVDNEAISIQGIGNYTFTNYPDSIVAPTHDVLKRLMVVITIHQSMNPNTSDSFGDNGSTDEYPILALRDKKGRKIKFWRNWPNKIGGCVDGIQTWSVRYNRFWLFAGTVIRDMPC